MSNRSIFDILNLNANIPEDWQIIKQEYIPVNISQLKIDGDTFTNYGGIQFAWEKSYFVDPKRSSGGVIGNLNAQATLIVPHLIFNFSIMSIDDYRAIAKKDLEKNEFTVECYDPIYNTTTKNKMYFAPLQMAKLYTINKIRFNNGAWEEFIELAGVHDYTVEMIGTNADLDLISVIYHLNPPNSTGRGDETIGEQDVYKGEEIIIGQASNFQEETFDGSYKFKGWNINALGGEKGNYIDGNAYTINSDLILYAQWQPTTEHILTYNYGLSDPELNEQEYEYKNNIKIAEGQSIGVLPTPEIPSVKVKDLDGKDIIVTPYENGQWWKVPQKTTKVDENGNDITETLKVKNNEPYWSNKDKTIYWLLDTIEYNLTLMVDGDAFATNKIKYNENMNLPMLVKKDFRFDGWYTATDHKASGKMPPYDITLYAKWEKITQ